MSKRGVIIANTGSPEAPTPWAVRSYLMDFLSDPRIRPMNALAWQLILRSFVLPRRSVRSAAKYELIWSAEGSPQDVHMRALARKLGDELWEDGMLTMVRHAMSYGSPSMDMVLQEMFEWGCDELVVIPLYPQSASSTTRVVEDKLAGTLRKMGWKPRLRFVERYHDSPLYLDAMARAIHDAGFDSAEDTLLEVFHSVPMKDLHRGDSYDAQTQESATQIARRLGLEDGAWRYAYQCRFDKSRAWVGPFSTEVLGSLAQDGGRLFIVAPGFSIDCLETLFDIDIALRKSFRELRPGSEDSEFVYVPCLNESDDHVRLLANLVDLPG